MKSAETVTVTREQLLVGMMFWHMNYQEPDFPTMEKLKEEGLSTLEAIGVQSNYLFKKLGETE